MPFRTKFPMRGVLVRGFLAEKIHALNQSWSEHKDNPPHHRGKNYRLNTDSHRRCKLKRRGRDIPLGISPVCRGESRQPLSGRHVLRAHPRKDWLTEWGSTGQPYLLFYRKTTGTETIYQWVNTTDTDSLMFDYSKPELLSRYGNCYTAAAMSCYNQLHSKSSDFVP